MLAKHIFLLFVFNISMFVSAQDSENKIFNLFYDDELKINPIQLKLISNKNTPAQKQNMIHKQYELWYKQMPIKFLVYKTHQYLDKTIVQHNIPNLDNINVHYEPNATAWIYKNQHLYQVIEKAIHHSNNTYSSTFWHGDSIIYSFIQSLGNRDTNINAKVFIPNPIIALQQPYGGLLADNDDNNNSVLQSALSNRSISVTYSNSSVYPFLLNKYQFVFQDISAPRVPEINSVDSAIFSRNQLGFENIMVYYHLGYFSQYIKSLGFDNFLEPLIIDCHANNGLDNSYYSYQQALHTIEYGVGGIDDAEDAEVIIHEFAHSLSNTASPNTVVGVERSTIEEGIADYFAHSAFKSNQNFRRYDLYSWDANTIDWTGTNTHSGKTYQSDLQGDKYLDRDIWSTPLVCIWDSIGKKKADELMLTTLTYLMPNMSMPELAEQIISLDTILNKAKYYNQIKSCFIKSGILKFDERDIKNKTISEQLKYSMLNSQGFANGTGTLGIKFQKSINFHCSIYNSIGQLVIHLPNQYAEALYLNPEQLTKGLYYIHIEPIMHKSGFKNFKLIEPIVRLQ